VRRAQRAGLPSGWRQRRRGLSRIWSTRAYGEAGRDFLAETQLPEDVTAVVTNPPYERRLFEFVDRALELTRLVGGTVAILINTRWQTGAANSIRLRHPAFQASVMLTNRIAWSRTPGLARLMFSGKDAETEPEARCCIVCLPYAASVHGSCRSRLCSATCQAPRHGPAPHGLRIVGAIGRGFWRWSAWFLRKVLAYNLSLRFERTFAME
jgi:hypothetical protein